MQRMSIGVLRLVGLRESRASLSPHSQRAPPVAATFIYRCFAYYVCARLWHGVVCATAAGRTGTDPQGGILLTQHLYPASPPNPKRNWSQVQLHSGLRQVCETCVPFTRDPFSTSLHEAQQSAQHPTHQWPFVSLAVMSLPQVSIEDQRNSHLYSLNSASLGNETVSAQLWSASPLVATSRRGGSCPM